MSSNHTRCQVAHYARVSTTGQGQNTGLQLEELRSVAAQHGWTIVGEFVDESISGAQASRLERDRLRGTATLVRFHLVAVWNLDHLARSRSDLLTLLNELANQSVGFTSLRDPGMDATSPAGRVILPIMGAFAAFELGLLRERVRAGMQGLDPEGRLWAGEK